MSTNDELWEQYRRALFEVDAPAGRVRLALEQKNPALDALLVAHDVADWAFITAWNPGALRPGRAVNDRAQRLLEQQVRATGFQMWTGDGASMDRTFIEDSILVGGIDRASARALGQAFAQR